MQWERWGVRDLSYSAWHRAGSIGRFLGFEKARDLTLADLDGIIFVEYRPFSKVPLVLVEAGIDVGQQRKDARVLEALAWRANLPAYAVLYAHSESRNPADPRFQDIDRFRIRRVYPHGEANWTELAPQEWAERLVQIRAWSERRTGLIAANDESWTK